MEFSVKRGLVRYPVPLNDGSLAFLNLPANFNSKDYARCVSVMQTLVVDDEMVDAENTLERAKQMSVRQLIAAGGANLPEKP